MNYGSVAGMASFRDSYSAALQSPAFDNTESTIESSQTTPAVPAKLQSTVSSENMVSPEKAVIIDNVPNTVIDDYVKSVSDIISGINITHCSRISGGNICIFTKTVENVDRLVQEGTLLVKEVMTPVRRFKSASTRVVFSNVFPFITNAAIVSKMSKWGRILGHVRDIPTGSKVQGCSHIKSFRRTAQYIFDDLSKVPSTIQIPYEGNYFSVYISMDDVVCHHCKAIGHIKKNCPQLLTVSNGENEFPVLVCNTAFQKPVSSVQVVVPKVPLPSRNSETEQHTFDSSATVLEMSPKHIKRRRSEIDFNKDTGNNSTITENTSSNDHQVKNPVYETAVAFSVETTELHECNETFAESVSSPANIGAHIVTDVVPATDTTSVSSATQEIDEVLDKGAECDSLASDTSMGDALLSEEIPKDNLMTAKEFKALLKATRNQKVMLPIVKQYTKDFVALQQLIEKQLTKTKAIDERRHLQRLLTTIKKDSC